MDLQSIALATWPRRLVLRNLEKGWRSVKIGRIWVSGGFARYAGSIVRLQRLT